MTKKNKYHKLDDIGFIGVPNQRSDKDIERDAKITSDYISQYKSDKSSVSKTGGRTDNSKVLQKSKYKRVSGQSKKA